MTCPLSPGLADEPGTGLQQAWSCSTSRHCCRKTCAESTAETMPVRNLMKKPISLSQMLVLNAYWVGLSFMWNALHPIILPAVLLNYIPDAQKNTYLGLLTFVGLVIAMVVQPLSGALSDGWASRFGRRRPLIVIGTLFDFIFLVLLA